MRGELESGGGDALNVTFWSTDINLKQSFNILFVKTEKTPWSIYKVSAFPETSQFWAAHVGLQESVGWCKSRTSCLGCEGYWPRCNPSSSGQVHGKYAMFLTRAWGCFFLVWFFLPKLSPEEILLKVLMELLQLLAKYQQKNWKLKTSGEDVDVKVVDCWSQMWWNSWIFINSLLWLMLMLWRSITPGPSLLGS